MPDVQQHTHKFVIEVDGQAITDDVVKGLAALRVEDNLHLPDLFQLTFRDHERNMLEQTHLKIGSKVVISVISNAAPGPEPLMTGEVTALESSFDALGTFTVARGFDHSHRLFRGRVTETYMNVTYADVAKKVAVRAGLEAGNIEATNVVKDHVSQPNLNDWQELNGLAGEIGYEVAVADARLHFRKPANAESAPDSGNVINEQALQLTLGGTLLEAHAIVTSAEQVKEVTVRGWDVNQKRSLIGHSPAETTSAVLTVKPADLASKFSAPSYVGVDTPYRTQAEVDAAAKAVSERIASAFAEISGVARGNPKLKAGVAVSLGLAGEPFDGRYTLTTTTHQYDPEAGYTTAFVASGRQERSLLGLSSGGSSNNNGSGPRIHGVVNALVTDARDPANLGRVKLKFPWLSDTYETDWARTVQPGAGNKRGAVVLPEVNDEVLVAFEQGDMRFPYVLGGLYNGVDKPELGNGLVDASGHIKRRGFISRKGHKLVFLDDDGQSGVMLATADDGLRIALKATGTTIKVSSKGKVEIEGATNVDIKAGSKLSLSGSAGVSIESGGEVSLKGSVIRLN